MANVLSGDDSVKRLVTLPDGTECVIRVEQAPRPGLFLHGPWRLWASVSGDRFWWLTVESSTPMPFPVVRERWLKREQAIARQAQLANEFRSGARALPTRPAWRRTRPL
jgi:hypothetical protein